jgi:hypothetical protein
MNPILSPPPEGSSFRFETTDEGWNRVSWRTAPPWYLRLGPAAFIGFWLMGWAAGEMFAIGALVGMFAGAGPFAGAQNPGGGFQWFAALFLIGWLGAWTVGGLAAMWALHKLLQRPRDESVTLADDELIYDPGSLSFEAIQNANNSRQTAQAFRKGIKPCTISLSQLGEIRLEHVGDAQRLSVDVGAERITIGQSLREPEREWLASALKRWAGQT